MTKLKKCPFCGLIPVLEECYGTHYEYYCPCGMARFSVQISDLMTIKERCIDSFDRDKCQYKKEFIDRAENEFIELWNKRSR